MKKLLFLGLPAFLALAACEPDEPPVRGNVIDVEDQLCRDNPAKCELVYPEHNEVAE